MGSDPYPPTTSPTPDRIVDRTVAKLAVLLLLGSQPKREVILPEVRLSSARILNAFLHHTPLDRNCLFRCGRRDRKKPHRQSASTYLIAHRGALHVHLSPPRSYHPCSNVIQIYSNPKSKTLPLEMPTQLLQSFPMLLQFLASTHSHTNWTGHYCTRRICPYFMFTERRRDLPGEYQGKGCARNFDTCLPYNSSKAGESDDSTLRL